MQGFYGRLHRQCQRGAILLVTLIIMAVMALASVAMMRSVDVSVLQAGNFSFMLDQANVANLCIRRATDWYLQQVQGPTKNYDPVNDDPNINYFSSMRLPSQMDTTYEVPKLVTANKTSGWAAASSNLQAPVIQPYGAGVVGVDCMIERMCTVAGVPATRDKCLLSRTTKWNTDDTAGAGAADFSNFDVPLMRVSVRVDDVRRGGSYFSQHVFSLSISP